MWAKHKRAFLIVRWLLPFSLSYTAGAVTVKFQQAVTYQVGTTPLAIASGDFNGDGKVDLVVANVGTPGAGDDGSVSILLGNGDGTFQPANNIAAGKNPISIAVGDFNGDSRLDFAGADSGNSTVSVLLGKGDGTFQAPVSYATGVGPTFIAEGDFNEDRRIDLVVANNGGSTVSLLLGNGDGTFQSHVDYATGGFPSSIAIADLNGDSHLDIVVTGAGGVLLGNGDGTFQRVVNYGSFFDVAIGDFSGDTRPDLLVTFQGGFNVDVGLLAGNGDGTFSTFSSISTVNTGVCHNRYPLAADFNGDGKLDLAIMGGFSTQSGVCAGHHLDVVLLITNGDGTFQAPVTFSATDAANNILGAASFDLNADNSPDIVTVNSDNTLTVLLNATGADFSISASPPTPGTISRGQSSTSTVTLNRLNAFDNPVALTCSVQPTQSAPTCSLNPSSVTFDANGNATATLAINTGMATALLVPNSPLRDSRPLGFLWLPVAGFALMGVGFRSGYATRRTLTVSLLSGILCVGLIFQAACGGGGPGTTTYTVTITGTSGSTQHSTTTTLTQH